MIKVHLHPSYPKKERPEDYRGVTELHYNYGPAPIEVIIANVVVDLFNFHTSTHPMTEEETKALLENVHEYIDAIQILEGK